MSPGSISSLLSPLVPPLERDSKEKPPEAALPCKGAEGSSHCSILPPPLAQLSHFLRVKRGKQKACVRKWGLASAAACSTGLWWPPPEVSQLPLPHSRDAVHPPSLGRDVCFSYLLWAAALQLWLQNICLAWKSH